MLAEAFAVSWETSNVDVRRPLQMGLDSIVALSVVQAARRRQVALRARLMVECDTIRELAKRPLTPMPHGRPPAMPAADPGATQHSWLYSTATRAGWHKPGRQVLWIAANAWMPCWPRSSTDTRCCGASSTGMRGPCRTASWTFSARFGWRWARGGRADSERAGESRPQAGRLLSAVWLREPDGPGVLVLTAHVLAMDPFLADCAG